MEYPLRRDNICHQACEAPMSDSSEYLRQFKGRFVSTLRWEQLDALWAVLREDAQGGWYLYAVGESPPARPATGDQVASFLDEVYRLLKDEHEEDYCGIVYADDLRSPGFVKIYDPNNLGVVCGFSETPPLPGWTLSKVVPEDLRTAMPPPGNRRRWWRRLLGMAE